MAGLPTDTTGVLQIPDAGPLRVLVVDDDASTRLLVGAMLRRTGHEAITAEDGQAAVDTFRAENVDLVFMDVNMPVMNGLDATRRIKRLAGEDFVPVIFLTGEEGSAALSRCVDAGGDDFLSKPVHPVVLEAKLAAFSRIRRLNREVLEKNRVLQQVHEANLAELEVAEAIFERITNKGTLRSGLYRFRLSPASLFNGDLALAAATRNGGQRILLGDFTGHGLPAAVGALPLSDIFYSMTAKGSSIGDIVIEANRKLRGVLPVGMFCAAALIDVDPANEYIKVWNGGMPDLLMFSEGGEILRRFESQHIALGIGAATESYAEAQVHPMVGGARIFGFTDGLPEARNELGEEFGLRRTAAALRAPDPFVSLQRWHSEFVGEQPLEDDLTLIEVDLDRIHDRCFSLGAEPASPSVVSCAEVAVDWSLNVVFSLPALRYNDPILYLMHAVSEMRIPAATQGALFTVLTELFVNALDHGLLGLDSAMKSTVDGFARYFEERDARLAERDQGRIEISVANEARGEDGHLRIRVQDTGPGFDHESTLARARSREADSSLHGRGLSLLLELCSELEYRDGGRCVEALVPWSCRLAPVPA